MYCDIQCLLFAAIAASFCSLSTAADLPLGDMTPFKQIAEETLKFVEKGDFKSAKSRIKDLETTWDNSEPKLKSVNPTTWSSADKSIDQALKDVRAAKPNAETSSKSLKALIAKFDAIHKK